MKTTPATIVYVDEFSQGEYSVYYTLEGSKSLMQIQVDDLILKPYGCDLKTACTGDYKELLKTHTGERVENWDFIIENPELVAVFNPWLDKNTRWAIMESHPQPKSNAA